MTEPPLAVFSMPDRFEIDGPVVARHVQERDVPIVAPAFRDPGIGGENGMPPFDEDELRAALGTRIPEMSARGILVRTSSRTRPTDRCSADSRSATSTRCEQ